MNYDAKRLDNLKILSSNELEKLEKLEKLSFKNIQNNSSLLEKLSFDFIYTSAKIEGNTYTLAEALTLLQTKKPSSNKKIDDANMILNLQEAFDFILKNKPSISKHNIRQIHQIISKGLLKDINNEGNFRSTKIGITGTDYIPLSDKLQLELEFDRLLKNYVKIKNPFEKAIYLHNNLAYLQCFIDCNKRTARMLQNLSLINDDKIFISFNANNADIVSNYLEGILHYYNTGEHSLYNSFFIREYKRTIDYLSEFNHK